MGTVVEYTGADGQPKKMVVLDAKYRAANLAWTNLSSPTGSSSAGLKGFTVYRSKYIFEENIPAKSRIPSKLVNSYLVTKYPGLSGDLTAKENCDAFIAARGLSGVPAISFARRQLIEDNGVITGCDVPNLFQLIIIFMLSDDLDRLDPTSKDYSENRLGRKHPKGRFNAAKDNTNIVISSTYCGFYSNSHMNNSIYNSQTHTCGHSSSARRFITPILEI